MSMRLAMVFVVVVIVHQLTAGNPPDTTVSNCEMKWRAILVLTLSQAELRFRLDSGAAHKSFRLEDVRNVSNDEALRRVTHKGNWTIENIKLAPRSTTDKTLELCGLLGQTESVDLKYCYNISDRGVAHVVRLKGLRKVIFSDNNPRKRNNLVPREFDLRKQPRITDKTLEHLSRCETLEELYSWYVPFTAKGLAFLHGKKSLRKVVMSGVVATPEEIATLKKHLPQCHVDITPLP